MQEPQYSSAYFDIVIVGAGPAGLGAAHELVQRGIQGSRIVVLDMGPAINERVEARRSGAEYLNTFGLGGAGLFSDGKITVPSEKLFPPDFGAIPPNMWDVLPNHHISENDASKLYQSAYNLYQSLGVRLQRYRVASQEILQLYEQFKGIGVHFRYREVDQIEPSDLPKLVGRLRDRLEAAGVTFMLSTQVTDLEINFENAHKAVKCRQGRTFSMLECQDLVLALGKIGLPWLRSQSEKLNISRTFRPIEVGVRVEVPKTILEPYTNIHRDLKLIRKIDDSSLVTTFCTCVEGIVAPCQYDELLVLGGYTGEIRSENTNFAFLVKMNLDLDQSNMVNYGYSLIHTANIVGRGRPIVQRLGDLMRGQSTTPESIQKNSVHTTLMDYTLSDIGLVFPKKIVNALLETLKVFNDVVVGIAHEDNIISAPCLEHCYEKFLVDRYMETNVKRLYIAGDVAGYTRGILTATASGMLAATGVAHQYNSK